MNSNKKRKNQLLDSDEENDMNSLASATKKNSSKTKTTKMEEKKIKRKRIVLLSDSEDDDQNSISNIKKNAKVRAKRLANDYGKDEKPPRKTGQNSTPSSSKKNKSPPSDSKQKNILNYFKKINLPDKKDDVIKENGDSNRKCEITKEIDDEGFVFTQVKKPPEKNHIIDVKKKEKPRYHKSPSKSERDDRKNDAKRPKIKAEIKDDEDDKYRSKESPRKKSDDQIKDHSKIKKSPQKPRPPEDVQINKKSKNEIPKSPKKKDNQKEFEKILEPIVKKKEKLKSPKKSKPIEPALPRIVEEKKVSRLWVDKYKPTNVKQIIGQQGDRSALNKLIKWLRNWHQNLDKKPGFGKWGSDDGAGHRAAMLSGPPGIGKTTAAQLVCKELGYDFLELNASDTRSKKSMTENVRELLKNTKLTEFFRSSKTSKQKLTAKHCLIMDEVDGVSGNEDRGGVAELIQLIKSTKVPIICICNDRGDQKMRSLVNYCFDLRFPKPKLEQIKASLMSIAFKEKAKISPDVMNDLIISSNYDIRQCIHNLYLLASNHSRTGNMINPNEKPIKDVRLNPFEAIRKVFCTGQDYESMTYNDKSDLFFCDYSIMPLFVYENYPQVNLSSKHSSIGKQLKRLYKTIDSISYGDLFEKEIRTNQSWSLLPMQAAFSTVMPSSYMRSHNGLGLAQFPSFMGKLSTTNKNNRIAEELVAHMKLAISGSKTSLIMDYLEILRNQIIDPLVQLDVASISQILDLLEAYSLTKENMNSIIEFCLWACDEDPMKRIDSKTKAALTRAYNKKDFALPYACEGDSIKISSGKGGKSAKKKGGKGNKKDWDASSQEDDDDADAEDHEEEQDALDFY